jgi:hypothetical protein
MKLDPGMHIGLHLVFFGKTGVTLVYWLDCVDDIFKLSHQYKFDNLE